MNQQQEELQSHSRLALVNRTAHTIGFFAARTYLRIQSITHNVHEKANRLDQPKAKQTKPPDQTAEPSEQELGRATRQTEESKQLPTRKAEEMVDHLAQRLSSFAAIAKLTVQRTAARAREDVEDVWAEAQSIRHHQKVVVSSKRIIKE